jgi:hypothetical protein
MSAVKTVAEPLTAACSCGRVEMSLAGTPICSLICYCEDCQEGSARIEQLPGAPTIREPDGGTAYLVYRNDRVQCIRGAELLSPLKLRANSATSRVIASCCNSVMMLNFDDAKHWVDVYPARVRGYRGSPELRVCTKSRRAARALPEDMPNYPGYPLRFLGKLLGAKVRMMLGL